MAPEPRATLAATAARAGPWLVGYGSGLDSTVLLHRWPEDSMDARAIHVHHGLQAGADHWAAHCERTCRALGVAFQVVRIEVARGSGEGLEAAARRGRMAAFAQALEDGGVLALAHHRDDQAETLLLRALRASGSDGLGAMRPSRRFARGWLWRPFLALPRQALLDYARAHGLEWIEDPSNASDAHDRNYLRRRVMPLLQARWPQAAAALARAAQLQREAVDLLEAGDREALALVRGADPACLHAGPLTALPARRARCCAAGSTPSACRRCPPAVAGTPWLRQAPRTPPSLARRGPAVARLAGPGPGPAVPDGRLA